MYGFQKNRSPFNPSHFFHFFSMKQHLAFSSIKQNHLKSRHVKKIALNFNVNFQSPLSSGRPSQLKGRIKH